MTSCYLQPCILHNNAIITYTGPIYFYPGCLYIYRQGFLFVHARLGVVLLPTSKLSRLQFQDMVMTFYFFVMLLPVVSHAHTHNSVLCICLTVLLLSSFCVSCQSSSSSLSSSSTIWQSEFKFCSGHHAAGFIQGSLAWWQITAGQRTMSGQK